MHTKQANKTEVAKNIRAVRKAITTSHNSRKCYVKNQIKLKSLKKGQRVRLKLIANYYIFQV